MTATHFSGPLMATGTAPGSSGINPEAGPSIWYQGDALEDPRYPYAGGQTGVGSRPAWAVTQDVVVCDCVPAANGAAVLAAAATATSGAALTMVSASGNGIYVNVPMVPFGQQITAANVLKTAWVGPGHTTGTTASGSTSVTSVGDTRALAVGMYVCIPDGAAAGTPLIAQITAKTASTLTLSVAAGAAVSGAAIIPMDNRGVTALPYVNGGVGSLFDPYSALMRGWSVTSNNAGDTGWSVTATGYDVYGQKQTETVAVSANAIAYGKKTFKCFTSFVPSKSGGGSTTGTLSIGTSDVVGFGLRSDEWEMTSVDWAGAAVTSSTGWTVADATNPATATTGDVRGTMQLSGIGGGTGIGTNQTNGTRRLVMIQIPSSRNILAATSADYTSLLGVLPA